MGLQLTDEFVDWIAQRLPDPVINPLGGRPPLDKKQVLRGIFWILDHGAKWKDLPKKFGAKSSVHAYFLKWVREGVFEKIMRDAGKLVEDRGEYRLYECFVDGTFCKAKGGGDGVGCTRVGKGVKIMILVDARGVPVAVEATAAGPHESQCVQQLFDFCLTSELPKRVIGDKAYDSDELDAKLAEQGVALIAPHRSNRLPRNKTQDGRVLRRYKRRWTVERTIAFIQNFRRLCIRYEKTLARFQGMLQLATSFLLLRTVYG